MRGWSCPRSPEGRWDEPPSEGPWLCTGKNLRAIHYKVQASQVAQLVKNTLANARDARGIGSIPGLGGSTGMGNGNPLQYSCLENTMDRGAWWAAVHGISKRRTRLSMHACMHSKVKEGFFRENQIPQTECSPYSEGERGLKWVGQFLWAR